jgi:Family of unknown function (DUF5690)
VSVLSRNGFDAFDTLRIAAPAEPLMTTADQRKGRITRWLDTAPAAVFTLYAIAAAFTTYFCMYAFRKPFSAAQFEGQYFLGGKFGLKTVLAISQIIGYATSKYLGIKVCSEIKPGQRALALVGLILWAQAALVGFGFAPDSFKVVAIFLNGLALGMVWGMVVGFLEGRRTSEYLLAGLSCSYIVSSGAVKTVGQRLMGDFGCSEAWMPAAVGGLFLPPFLAAVWFLNQMPPATVEDHEARTLRETMNRVHRWAFVRHFFWGLLLVLTTYFFLTAYRDFRDTFMVDIFKELNYSDRENRFILTQTDTLVAFGVMASLALLNLIRNNRRGFFAAIGLMIGGLLLVGAATVMLDRGWIDGFAWVTLIGLGSYWAYVPVGSVLFDRLIASTRVVGTAVFAIYLADSIGYTGSVGTMIVKDRFVGQMSRLDFLRNFSYFLSLVGTTLLAGSIVYFAMHKGRHTEQQADRN